jgi:hypothetical protein
MFSRVFYAQHEHYCFGSIVQASAVAQIRIHFGGLDPDLDPHWEYLRDEDFS